MAVAIGEPEPALARRAPDDRPRIGEARTRAEPRLRFDGVAEREQFARGGHQAIELHRGRRRIARSEFDAGCEPDALFHRRQAVAVFGIEDRAGPGRIALGAEMTVIAALDRKRQRYAERTEQVRRPRPERDHDIAGIDRAGRRIDAPVRLGAMQRARIAGEDKPPSAAKRAA